MGWIARFSFITGTLIGVCLLTARLLLDIEGGPTPHGAVLIACVGFGWVFILTTIERIIKR